MATLNGHFLRGLAVSGVAAFAMVFVAMVHWVDDGFRAFLAGAGAFIIGVQVCALCMKEAQETVQETVPGIMADAILPVFGNELPSTPQPAGKQLIINTCPDCLKLREPDGTSKPCKLAHDPLVQLHREAESRKEA